METSILTPPQKHAAAGLFAVALHHSHIHRTSINSPASVANEENGGVSVTSDLLCPVLRFLGIDTEAWNAIQETGGSSAQARHHIGGFLALLSEECDVPSSETKDKELALSKEVDAVELTLATSDSFDEAGRSQEYELKCREKYSNAESKSFSNTTAVPHETTQGTGHKLSAGDGSGIVTMNKPLEEGTSLSYQRKVTVLYELLSACLADNTESTDKTSPFVKSYDARHRVALRLLTTWLGVQWNKMEALEVLVSCSMMDSVTEKGANEEETETPENPGAKWKRGGIISAAMITGGTLMAITGGIAAPAVAQGVGALAPTLGALVPAIGASGFSAAAGAVGTATGSAAFAASFGAAGAGLTGTKMARRIGSIDEFEFKAVGQNHDQGRLAAGILICGLVFQSEDFVRPWEGHNDNLERYALQWESKNLIAASTAIQDWLTSRLAIELMKQGAMTTVLSPLLSALALPAALVTLFDIIDSKWAIAMDRSDKAGELLADVLLHRLQGNRPVTLIGFSLGARVIFRCLQCLADGANAGLVERTVLLGAPIAVKDESWKNAREMVAGRFINAYSTNDWTLGVAFRASLLSQGLAGIQPVDVPGVENVDVTHLIEGHSSYLWATKQILEQLKLETYYPVHMSTSSMSQEEKSS